MFLKLAGTLEYLVKRSTNGKDLVLGSTIFTLIMFGCLGYTIVRFVTLCLIADLPFAVFYLFVMLINILL